MILTLTGAPLSQETIVFQFIFHVTALFSNDKKSALSTLNLTTVGNKVKTTSLSNTGTGFYIFFKTTKVLMKPLAPLFFRRLYHQKPKSSRIPFHFFKAPKYMYNHWSFLPSCINAKSISKSDSNSDSNLDDFGFYQNTRGLRTKLCMLNCNISSFNCIFIV